MTEKKSLKRNICVRKIRDTHRDSLYSAIHVINFNNFQFVLLVLNLNNTEGTTPATGHDILEVPVTFNSHN